MERFELSTPCSQSRCATKLRHIPVNPNGGAGTSVPAGQASLT